MLLMQGVVARNFSHAFCTMLTSVMSQTHQHLLELRTPESYSHTGTVWVVETDV